MELLSHRTNCHYQLLISSIIDSFQRLGQLCHCASTTVFPDSHLIAPLPETKLQVPTKNATLCIARGPGGRGQCRGRALHRSDHHLFQLSHRPAYNLIYHEYVSIPRSCATSNQRFSDTEWLFRLHQRHPRNRTPSRQCQLASTRKKALSGSSAGACGNGRGKRVTKNGRTWVIATPSSMGNHSIDPSGPAQGRWCQQTIQTAFRQKISDYLVTPLHRCPVNRRQPVTNRVLARCLRTCHGRPQSSSPKLSGSTMRWPRISICRVDLGPL